ncbi:MAG: hydantoinase B/oxoprolinase family protein [Cytophagales bacterium]|nr:hydantoinase B/oxoprolinase family protein [Bernardetiaceae bacterium]MDW8210469.1 hydantoinase B/oxoprolinase family protein [Cytophagales bacterium]
MNRCWHFWVDTGGTFTDCIALDPYGRWHTCKVLSSGVVRGQVICAEGKACKVHFPFRQDIFQGYFFRLLPEGEQYTVEGSSLEEGLLFLNQTLPPLPAGALFELTAGEEAPLLAARLLTRTSLSQALPPMVMKLGTTKGTNALLEGKTPKVALVVTKGFADLLNIGSQQRPDIFALQIRKPSLPSHFVVEVDERIDALGKVIKPLEKEEVSRLIEHLKAIGATSVAVSLINSYLNPVHEQYLINQLQQVGFLYLSSGAELMPLIKYEWRTLTALANAALAPVISNYLDAIGSKVEQLQVISSAGNLSNYRQFAPKDSLLSGPAAGVIGAWKHTKDTPFARCITFDMGGTSTDVARINRIPEWKAETQVGGLWLMNRAVCIQTVAAGGGSICFFDGHRLAVGPQSAGAFPGPACYGNGGPLTITDVNLLAGRLLPDNFSIPLNRHAAEVALQKLQQEIFAATGEEVDRATLLQNLLQLANEKMAEAIRLITTRKGENPAEYTLVAFGGAGGQHICHVADLLDISQILVPRYAGLFCAYGIGQTEVAHTQAMQILLPLPDFFQYRDEIFDQLKTQAVQPLLSQGYRKEQIVLGSTSGELRLKGQESTLAVELAPTDSLEQVANLFKQQYKQLYGYFPPDEPIIEVVAIWLTMIVKQEYQQYPPLPAEELIEVTSEEKYHNLTIFRPDQLPTGATAEGEAILLSHYHTVYVPAHWRWERLSNGDIALYRLKKHSPSCSTTVQAAALELFTNRFTAIAEEMGAVLQRTAFSVNVKERLDFSCALLNAHGELVVNAPHVPVHLGSLGVCVRSVKSLLPMQPGDVVITNHPAFGGSHLPDVTLIAPVFFNEQLVGYLANRAHHAEIGGTRPGSMPPTACQLIQEGVVIPPTYLVKGGIAQWEVIQKIFTQAPYPTRALQENLADLQAALASIQAGVIGLQKLCANYGTEQVTYYMEKLKEYAYQCLQRSLQQLPAQSFSAVEYLDDGSPLCVKIDLSGEKIVIDFSGTAPAHAGNLNATPAIVNSVVMYVLRLLIAAKLPNEYVPLNEGIMQAVSMYLPEGSLLNPKFDLNPANCPAVVGGNTEVSQRLADTLIKALELMACSQGTMNNLIFGNDSFGYYETIGGGTGAGQGFDGADAVHSHMTNTRITDVEVLEKRYPVQVERFAIRCASGGNGKWKGGNGIERHIRFLVPVSLSLISQHRQQAPYGMAGGSPGATGKQWIVRKGRVIPLQGIDSAELQPQDLICIHTPGGGGYGKPD